MLNAFFVLQQRTHIKTWPKPTSSIHHPYALSCCTLPLSRDETILNDGPTNNHGAQCFYFSIVALSVVSSMWFQALTSCDWRLVFVMWVAIMCCCWSLACWFSLSSKDWLRYWQDLRCFRHSRSQSYNHVWELPIVRLTDWQPAEHLWEWASRQVTVRVDVCPSAGHCESGCLPISRTLWEWISAHQRVTVRVAFPTWTAGMMKKRLCPGFRLELFFFLANSWNLRTAVTWRLQVADDCLWFDADIVAESVC